MARLPRLSVPDLPHHVIQRGNNRQAIFGDDDDRRCFLALLTEGTIRQRVALHAYVLMDNHVHLLLTPETGEGLPLLMQDLGRRYVRHFNGRQRRTGTLWEGRYRSTVVQTDRYLLACMAYIDLNPVRAGIVARAEDFPWSSHGHYAGLRQDRALTPPATYWALGNTPFAREAAYAELVQDGLDAVQQARLREAVHGGWPLGDAGFVAELQRITPRRVVQGKAGRPFSSPAS